MKRTLSFSLLLLLLLATLALPAPAYASSLPDGKVVMGGSYTLSSGETLDGDLIIMGGTVTIEENATVNGDVALFGGSLDIAGDINGDVAAFGGTVTLQSTARVDGDLVNAGGTLDRDPQATITGQVVTDGGVPSFQFDLPFASPLDGRMNLYRNSFPGVLTHLFFGVLWLFFRVFMLSALAALVLMFLETPTQRIARAIIAQPALSGGVGCLTLIVAPLLLVVLGLTIILLPVTLVGFLLLILLALYGWIALGYETGQRLAVALKQKWAAPIAAGVGTFLISLILGGIAKVVPCVGWMIPWVGAGFGLGAVILTQLGTQAYPPTGGSAPEVLPAPSGDAAEPPSPSGDA